MKMLTYRSRKIPASFNGRICEIPGVYVDNFENPSEDGARAYFLSHYHTDHTVGLEKDALKEKLEKEKIVFIYATQMTAAIIVYNNEYLRDYVKILKPGSNLIVIKSGIKSNLPETILDVRLIPAGHCLGSTMFLFETMSTKVLYTGDFRIRPNDLSKYAGLHEKDGEVIKIDTLYVDTTFIDTHENFPKRSDSIEEAIALIRTFLESNEEQCVILDTSAKYGYEYVFNQIYKLLGIKVYVDNQKWKFYGSIEHLVPGVTNNESETRIFLKSIPLSRVFRLPPKKIKFSALRWDNWNEAKSSIVENRNNVYVCFATHCSRIELISFVDYLNPNKIVGFPNYYEVQNSLKTCTNDNFVMSPTNVKKKSTCPSKRPYPGDKKLDDETFRKIFK